LLALAISLPAQSPRAAAPVDLTGTWVSIVTEDWRYRMATPPKGDYPSVPLNADGKKLASAWDSAKDPAEACKNFGPGYLMRQPGRIRISWQDDNTLKLESDAGSQTRLFSFGARAGAGTLQGESRASWEFAGGRRGKDGGGSLKVVTSKAQPGHLQPNGVPFSPNAVFTEYYHRTAESNGDSWLLITILVDDPQYLTGPFQRSSHYKKVADSSGWSPSPCR
jgi:hypothetical protein